MIRVLRGPRSPVRSKGPVLKSRTLRVEQLEPRTLMSADDLLWALGALPAAGSALAAAQTATLGDDADTCVQNLGSAYTNYGRSTNMVVGRDMIRRTESQAFVRFDLRSVPGAVTSATLDLKALQWSSTSPSTLLQIRLVPDAGDGWLEGTGGYNFKSTGAMTWNNRPQGTSLAITIAASQWPPDGVFSIDVTSLVNQSFNANGIATFQLDVVPAARSKSSISFATRENYNPAYRPVLTVTTATQAKQAPTVAAAACAAPSPVTGTSTVLSVRGADDGGESNLVYTWTATSVPSGAPAPTFSVNGTNAAKNATVLFGRAGTYSFTATIADADGLSVTSSVTVVVNQTLASIAVSPAVASLAPGTKQQFSATGLDQFGNALATAPAFTWSTTGGSITTGGLLTAPATTGALTVTAAVGSIKGTASVTVAASSFFGLKDPALASLTQQLFVDGSISRLDMMEILRSVGNDDNMVDAIEIADLRTILGNSSTLKIPAYVQVLSTNVVYGNQANAFFQGEPLGNLTAGSSAGALNRLVDKWFLGADHPGDPGLTYASAAGSLFVGGPSHLDMFQGQLGDCYFIAALGSIADSSAAAVQNMFLDNDDGTWTVRFYAAGTADYVTVDRMLPVSSSGRFLFANYGRLAGDPHNELWIALAEKAYAQWNETGKEGRDGKNLYSSIEGGWMADVYAQVLGKNASSYYLRTTSDRLALINAMNSSLAVTIATRPGVSAYGLYGNHAYDVIAYNRITGKFTLYNPWGCCQPTTALTWAQLQSTCSLFSVANPSGSVPLAQTPRQPVRAVPGAFWAIDSARPACGQSAASSHASTNARWPNLAHGHYAGAASPDRHAQAVDAVLLASPA